MELFDRQVRLGVGPNGGTGFEVGEAGNNNIPLHIKFSIEKAEVESPNTGKITVWNLNPQHRAILDMKDYCAVVRAGYGSNISQVFTGAITHVETTYEGANTVSNIEAYDSRIELRDTNFSISYAKNIKPQLIYSDIASKMGCPILLSPLVAASTKKLTNGFSYVGAGKDALTRLCKFDGSKWTMQDNTLQITKPGEPISATCYELNAGSGLIGFPKRVTISASSADKDVKSTTGSKTAQTGWEVTYLMNLAIGVNSYVHVTSREISGYFRVQKVKIDGDNYEGDFQCTATLLELKG